MTTVRYNLDTSNDLIVKDIVEYSTKIDNNANKYVLLVIGQTKLIPLAERIIKELEDNGVNYCWRSSISTIEIYDSGTVLIMQRYTPTRFSYQIGGRVFAKSFIIGLEHMEEDDLRVLKQRVLRWKRYYDQN